MAYRVDCVHDAGFRAPVYALLNEETGTEARIAPGYGANLYRWAVPGVHGHTELLQGPEFDLGRGFDFGTPILMPFPNRIRAGRFSFAGRSYQLPVSDPPNHLHGLVCALPWEVEGAKAGDSAARLVLRLRSIYHNEITDHFPFDFGVRLSFALTSRGIDIEIAVTNLGSGAMPFGFGLHPWFHMPISPGSRRQECILRVPARRHWVLDGENLPTGEIRTPIPEKDFLFPKALGDTSLDEVYTDLVLDRGWVRCAFRDEEAGLELSVQADRQFREFVVHAPSHRRTVCLEPYTCATDAPNLQEHGLDAGMLVLDSGMTWIGNVRLRLRRLRRGN